MIPMTLAQIAEVVGGTVHGDPGTAVTGPAFIDSRSPEPAGLFVAFAGTTVDGHDFAEKAVAEGAAAVLGSRRLDVPMVVVEDPPGALGRLAHHVLGALPGVRVVGLTGSQGKTSTKDLLATVLGAAGQTVATRGNFNNEIGMPLTVLRAEPTTEYLVLEMGARGIGHLRDLCAIARPHVSLVLNVGLAHLGEFGSQDGIAQAKGELVEALDADGLAVLNLDDHRVAAMASRTAAPVRTYGESREADVRLADLDVDALGRPRFRLLADGQEAQVALKLVGEHQAHNAAAAAAVATGLGLPLADVARALSEATSGSRWRMELSERADGVTVLNDAYNANPDSMRAALKALAAIGRGAGGGQTGRRTIAVLGEMRELGDTSREEHDAVGRLAVRLDIGQLLVVGEPARAIHLGASLEGSWDQESIFVEDHDQALAWLRANLAPGDVVLFKASRAAALERLAQAVLDDVVPESDEGKEVQR